MALSREAILKHAGNVETREVHVPKWADENGDDTVLIRAMTVREFEMHQARVARANAAKQDNGTASAGLLARVIVDENGRRVFTDDDAAQIAELGVGQVAKLTEALYDVSGIGADDDEQADINEAVAGESDAQTSSS